MNSPSAGAAAVETVNAPSPSRSRRTPLDDSAEEVMARVPSRLTPGKEALEANDSVQLTVHVGNDGTEHRRMEVSSEGTAALWVFDNFFPVVTAHGASLITVEPVRRRLAAARADRSDWHWR